MKLDVGQLRGAEVGATLDFAQQGKPKLVDVPLSEIKVTGVVQQLGDRFLVTGSATAQVKLTCARCLKEFKAGLEAAFAEEFSRNPKEEQFPATDRSLDLAPMLRTVLLLSSPSRPLHDPKCRGLCPVCGKDLNVKPHTHRRVKPPSPFGALKKAK